jgi:hypothetical protein
MVDTNAICSEDKIKKPYMNQIETMLQETRRNNISFVIVVGHDSILGFGFTQKNCLKERLKPLLHHYNVKAYFGGSDQLFQHYTDTYLDSKVEYFTAGESTSLYYHS